MKKLATILLIILCALACTKKIYIPVETVREVSVHDTTYLHKTDTLVQVPEVSISDFIDITDTLHLRGTHSSATAWLDTTHRVLAGKLVQGGKLPVTIVEKERLVYRDSVVTQEIPVPVEIEKTVKVVPWIYKVLSVIGIFALCFIAIWAWFKFFK